MRLKSTLWALAFACAAVSCSDDLDDGPNGNSGNGEGLDGIKTYVKVAINTGTVTKASDGTSTGPDGGEGEGTELGEKAEYTVNDVTLILFDNRDNADLTEASEKAGFDFLAGSNIRGVGFAEVSSQGTSNVDEHRWAATVQVVMEEEQSAGVFGQEYGVIAVTNLGKDNDLYTIIESGAVGVEGKKIQTGKELANYMIGNTTYTSTTNGIVMSTHTKEWEINGTDVESTVTIEEGIDENDAPTVSVFVERLAAKIRIKDYTNATTSTTIQNFMYTLNEGSTPVAKVRLDNVAIVNQLTSGSYLLKRVTDEEEDQSSLSTTTKIKYLGDEVWSDVDGNESYNYVLDPWTLTRTNTADLPNDDANTSALTYKNRFTGIDYTTMWNNGITSADKISLAGATEASYNDNGGIRLAYVMENVTKSTQSLNGYSTGALFKATYFPDRLTDVAADGTSTTATYVDYNEEEGATSSELTSVDKDATGVDFYEYRGNLYASQEAIFIDILNGGADADHNYGSFSTGFATMTIKDYDSYFSNVSEPFGYIDDLNKKVEAYKTTNPSEDLSKKTMSDLTGAQMFNQFMADKKTQSFGDAKYYAGGVCYYPYWIRHANNNIASVMGIMEFAIVRNNIYDLTVSGMKTWGFSGTDVPDPTDPDEDGTARINVNLYVRNWVVRSNGDIIL